MLSSVVLCNMRVYNMRIIPAISALVLLNGCSLMPDHSLDYQRATDLPSLKLAQDGQITRSIKPLYAIPDIDAATVQTQAVVTEGKGRSKHFVAPLPKPLVVASSKDSTPPLTPISIKPQIVSDGNGHPVMQTAGDILQVWDNLNKALTAANIKVSDRNQSLGLYFVELTQDGKKVAYQLKLTRTSNDNVISLQKDDDTIADSDLSQRTLENVLKNWPAS